MKAIVQEKYGSADVLELREVERPAVTDDRILVRVKAAGVNMADWHLMTGLPTVARLALGFGAPKVTTRGSDVAGVVEEVGAAVTRFRPGDEVFGSASGAFAEFALSREGRLAPKPANLTFEQAAAVSMAGYTALQAVRDQGHVEPGQRVLVIGAAGGVGSFAVQLAKHFGAHVTGVCSTSKVELVRSLGADAVVDYTREPLSVDDTRGAFDVIIDTAGSRPLRMLRRLLTPRGTLVIVGAEGSGRVLGPVTRLLRAGVTSPFVGQRLVGLMATEKHEDLVTLAELLASGAVTPAIDRTFPLAETPDAIRHLEAGRAAGKVIVVP
jgi:NADPH:quinone reductase-like Zn-dependent oxidoreductase